VYYAALYRVPVELVEAIIEVESGWDPYAVSPKGALGLMQLMPETAYKLRVRNRFWVEENVRGGPEGGDLVAPTIGFVPENVLSIAFVPLELKFPSDGHSSSSYTLCTPMAAHLAHFSRAPRTTQKIDAGAMGLDYKRLKGDVSRRKRALRFLVQALTAVGEVAAYTVGGTPSSTSVFSESALLRERLASNAAMAGQNQLNELPYNQNIVVTDSGESLDTNAFALAVGPRPEPHWERSVWASDGTRHAQDSRAALAMTSLRSEPS
jgi:hypothetical protein